jgi:uncharacterized RDD family membrane protein YckC
VTQPPPSNPHPGYPPPGYAAPPPGGYGVPHQYAPPVYRPRPTGPGGAPLAEFGDRLLAYLLDSLILGAILLVPMLLLMAAVFVPYLHAIDALSRGEDPSFAPFLLTFLVLFFGILGLNVLATYLYQVTYQLRNGQTVGKRVMKLKIVDAETGAPMGLSAARKRWGIQLLLGFAGPGAYVDGLWQLWDQQKQTLHDKVARTVVVKVPA